MANNGVCRCGRAMNSLVYPSVPTGYGSCNLCRYDLAGTCGYYCAHCNDYRTHSVCPAAAPAVVTGGVQPPPQHGTTTTTGHHHHHHPSAWPPHPYMPPPPPPAHCGYASWPQPHAGQYQPLWNPAVYTPQPPPVYRPPPPRSGQKGSDINNPLVHAFMFGGIAEAGRDFVRLLFPQAHVDNDRHDTNQHGAATPDHTQDPNHGHDNQLGDDGGKDIDVE